MAQPRKLSRVGRVSPHLCTGNKGVRAEQEVVVASRLPYKRRSDRKWTKVDNLLDWNAAAPTFVALFCGGQIKVALKTHYNFQHTLGLNVLT